MLVTLNEILPDAKKNHYAVGLFNTVDLEMAKGVIAAAEEADSPVIIGTAEVLLPFSSLEELAADAGAAGQAGAGAGGAAFRPRSDPGKNPPGDGSGFHLDHVRLFHEQF